MRNRQVANHPSRRSILTCTHVLASLLRIGAAGFVLALLGIGSVAQARDRQAVAPGAANLPQGAKVLWVMPDFAVELETDQGRVPDIGSTTFAMQRVRAEMQKWQNKFGVSFVPLDDDAAASFADEITFCMALSRAIDLHYHGLTDLRLPGKRDQLDWTVGNDLSSIATRTGGDYLLVMLSQDSYEPITAKKGGSGPGVLGAVVAGAVAGVLHAPVMVLPKADFGDHDDTVHVHEGLLVDLHSGRVLWFSTIGGPQGDMRKAEGVAETVENILEMFPAGARH